MGSEGAQSLAHVEGEVWMIDFWATWCPPCQTPMQHNCDMLKKRKDDWAGQVRIIGLSIDSDMKTLEAHVDKKDWKIVEHYWRDKSSCSEVYSVSGVPHVMIIDKSGKIAYKGHPASRPNLEEDFDNLRKDIPLTGQGCATVESAGGEEAAPEGYVEMDGATLAADIEKATAGIEELTKNEDVVAIGK